MAKKARKKAGKKSSKKSVKKSAAKTKSKSKTKKKKPAAKSLGAKVAGAYRAVVDTIKGTGQLRNKMEQPGTSESE